MLCKKHKINEYLNGICNVINYLEAKEVKLPTPFVLAWVLERLDKLYNDFKTAIYSDFCNNQKAYTLESLLAAILDEYRRRKQQPTDSSEEEEAPGKVLYTNTKKGYLLKPWKKTKGKYCNHCKKPGHSPHECFVLHPHLKRPQKKDSSNNRVEKSKPNKARKEREEKEKALIASVNALGIIEKRKLQKPLKPQIPDDQRLIEISEDENDEYDDVDFEDVEMVFTTTSIPKDLTNALLGLVEKLHSKGYF